MKIHHIRKSTEFTDLLSKGKKAQGSMILVSYKESKKEEGLKTGIVVSKKVSPKAIQRNYIRRFIYEYLRNITKPPSIGVSFVIKVRKSVKDMKKKSLRKAIELDMKSLMAKIGIL